jgi:hypothetical protein
MRRRARKERLRELSKMMTMKSVEKRKSQNRCPELR